MIIICSSIRKINLKGDLISLLDNWKFIYKSKRIFYLGALRII